MTALLASTVECAAAQLEAGGSFTAHRDAQLLLLHLLCVDRAFLLTHAEHPLTPEQVTRYQQLIARRKTGEPIQYITGEREFYGLRLEVTPAVLIPRPETEHLVEAALEVIPLDRPIRIADIGTGSGAISIAIAHHRSLAEITALDISSAALEVARRNAAAHGVANRIRFLESNILSGVAGEQFDIVVSNPPYIADSDRESLEPQIRDHEPANALFAGPTGLEIYERLIPEAANTLLAGGWLLLEIGAGQQLPLQQLLIGWNHVSFVPDLQGISRVAIAQRP